MPEFLIRAKPDQYVDVAVSFGVDDSLDVASPNVGLVTDSLLLVDAEVSKHGGAAATSGPPARMTAPSLTFGPCWSRRRRTTPRARSAWPAFIIGNHRET